MNRLSIHSYAILVIASLNAFQLPSLAADRPNIVLIVADDLGYSDVGFNGGKEIPTPHLDAIAESGVVFSCGYASHPYCSPSRAGLFTGRYQQRFGHECNPQPDASYVDIALPPRSPELWDGMCTHNPTVHEFDGKYHLY